MVGNECGGLQLLLPPGIRIFSVEFSRSSLLPRSWEASGSADFREVHFFALSEASCGGSGKVQFLLETGAENGSPKISRAFPLVSPGNFRGYSSIVGSLMSSGVLDVRSPCDMSLPESFGALRSRFPLDPFLGPRGVSLGVLERFVPFLSTGISDAFLARPVRLAATGSATDEKAILLFSESVTFCLDRAVWLSWRGEGFAVAIGSAAAPLLKTEFGPPNSGGSVCPKGCVWL